MTRRCALPLLCVAVLGWPGVARAADPPLPPLTEAARETFDVWDNLRGGVRSGAALLNKLQVSASANAPFGLSGLRLHMQLFRTDGHSFAARVGDVQTVSNIEAVPATRLFESWIEQTIGSEGGPVALRAGLMDLNADFDSLDTASLFVNSSHGIGADLARSGTNGPSIFPVTALGLRASWMPSHRWTVRVAGFDGAPGDPGRPRAFVIAHLRARDGALLIGQADYRLSDTATIAAAGWTYTMRARSTTTGTPLGHDRGFYASVEAPVPGQTVWRGWLRAGIARGQLVTSYLGAGIAARGLFHRRPDDGLGLAVAHAGLAPAGRAVLKLPRTETTVEATYQYKVAKSLAIQPDLQFVHHPAGIAGADDALVAGLRFVVTARSSPSLSAAGSADPTVPPEGTPPQ